MSLGAGELRHWIEIQTRVNSKDSNGDDVVAWATVCHCWAKIMPMRGRELMLAKQANSEVTGGIKVRYRTGLSAGMRALHRHYFYDIHSVRSDQESGIEFLILDTSQGLSEG